MEFAPLTRGRSNKGKGPADMTVYPPVSVFLGDCGECQLDSTGGELAEGSLASPAERARAAKHPRRARDDAHGMVSHPFVLAYDREAVQIGRAHV